MHPTSTHFPVTLYLSFTLVASPKGRLNDKNKKQKNTNKNINYNNRKQTSQKTTLLLHLSLLSIASSFILVALGAALYHTSEPFCSNRQLYLQMFIM